MDISVSQRKKILNRIGRWQIYSQATDIDQLYMDDGFDHDLKDVRNGSKWLILGRKGSGKSALVYEFLNRYQNETSSHKQDFVPNLLFSRFRHFDREFDPSSAADLFKLDILLFAARKLQAYGLNKETIELAEQISKFYDNQRVWSYVKRATRSGLIGTILNLIPGSNGFGNNLKNAPAFNNEDAIQRSLEKVKAEMARLFRDHNPGPVFIFFDEIDLAFGNKKHTESFALYMQALNALLSACWTFRDIRLSGIEVFPVVVLRDDIFQSVGIADDGKWRNDSVRIRYSYGRFEHLATHRLKTAFIASGIPKRDLTEMSFTDVWGLIANTGAALAKKTIWENVVDRSFHRPRDFVQFIALMAQQSSQRSGPKKISVSDFKKSRAGYARYFRQELVDELGYKYSYVDKIEEFLDRVFFPASNSGEFKPLVRGSEMKVEVDKFTRGLRESGIVADSITLIGDLFARSVIGIETGNAKQQNTEIIFKFKDPEFEWPVGFETSFTLHPGIKDYFLMRNRALG